FLNLSARTGTNPALLSEAVIRTRNCMSFFVLDCSSTQAPLWAASFHPRKITLCAPTSTKASAGTRSSYEPSLLEPEPAVPSPRVVRPGALSDQTIETKPEQSVRYVP